MVQFIPLIVSMLQNKAQAEKQTTDNLLGDANKQNNVFTPVMPNNLSQTQSLLGTEDDEELKRRNMLYR